LIAGEDITPLERLLVMADAASGVSAVLDWDRWMFINVDLGVHLERPPQGEWMAMAASTQMGDQGAALCTSRLYDERGRVGVSTQSLLVGPRS
jgi:acyl-CoA thioesterase